MEKTNYERLDHIIGEDNLKIFDNEFKKCINIALKYSGIKLDDTGYPDKKQDNYDEAIKKMILVRRYMFAQLLEMWGSWKQTGDCHPKGIRMSKGSNKFASVIIEEIKLKGGNKMVRKVKISMLILKEIIATTDIYNMKDEGDQVSISGTLNGRYDVIDE